MQELVLSMEDINLELGNKELFQFKQLSVYQGERIGIIGKNGEGKSSLLKLIMGELESGVGRIQKEVDFSYFAQLPEELCDNNIEVNAELLSQFDVPDANFDLMSGGEQAKYRLAKIFSSYKEGLILDEPTTHLDQKSKEFLIEELRYYYGTLIFVSHDRYFLNNLATKIWEISEGIIKEYKGNYDDYRNQKEQEELENQNAQEKYNLEKKKLETSIKKQKEQVQKISKVSKSRANKNTKPDRLAGSKSKDTVQKNMFKQVKNLENRLEKLTPRQVFLNDKEISFPKHHFNEIHNPYPIMATGLSISYGDKIILDNCDFQFKKSQKIAIVGDNGVGKTSFLKKIYQGEDSIMVSSKVIFSVYEQLSYQLNSDKSILEYLLSQTDYSESVSRSVLNKLGFTQDELKKPLSLLSGGEKTRLSLSLVMTKPSNVLILDEPTNFIDLKTIEALESLIKSYQGIVIFTSHDSYFVENVATEIYELKNHKLILR